MGAGDANVIVEAAVTAATVAAAAAAAVAAAAEADVDTSTIVYADADDATAAELVESRDVLPSGIAAHSLGCE